MKQNMVKCLSFTKKKINKKNKNKKLTEGIDNFYQTKVVQCVEKSLPEFKCFLYEIKTVKVEKKFKLVGKKNADNY